ncbi:DNA ligase D [Burkholderia sp. L27(2015)]|uniref:DNA ligase D n=1 Tax=Burkholderia sp. L27(2015) TaxID=1641858 RepID=UPI00131A6429|nr:DNA ligase D [Burkholderia sp. L27(2015)]
MADKLSEYARKRHFDRTPEPSSAPSAKTPHAVAGKAARGLTGAQAGKHAGKHSGRQLFVVQKHAASHLHYDFRLELDGTLKSWAIPKGPSLDPSVKRLAVHVEDHPLDYANFEGVIPAGNYGAGEVIVWDYGTWEPVGGDATGDFARGKLKFTLTGEKLAGGWTLVKSHMRGSGAGKEQDTWLLFKERDAQAREEGNFSVTEASPESVISGAVLAADGREGGRKIAKPSVSRSPTHKARSAGAPGSNAVAASLPDSLAPQLATLVEHAPPSDDWSYEIKFDGYRLLARIDHGAGKPTVRLFTRNGHDWSHKFPRVAEALAGLDLKSGWLDGEAVVLDSEGLPSFQALQTALDGTHPDILYYLFDMPYMNGWDLRATPLVERRALLKNVSQADPNAVEHNPLRFSEDLHESAENLLRSACSMRLEGIIGKRCDSTYIEGRSSAWIKLKCRQRQEFVIAGYSDPAGKRSGFGALLLGVHDAQGELQYAGRVGTGFDQTLLDQIEQRLKKRSRSRSPFKIPPKERSRVPVHWVRPDLVAEIMFSEWTNEGLVRQASFVALREDKPAAQIVREIPRDASAGEKREAMSTQDSAGDQVAGITITHPDRVIDKAAHVDKIMLARYYDSVAERMLPHLADRPVALLRGMDGISGEQFFQKHEERMVIPHVARHPGLDPGHAPLLTIDNVEALIGAVQMGTLEFHTWNGSIRNLEKPDRMIFDLDPDPKLAWERMVEAAMLLRTLLGELGLEAFIKTSGGKGFHVVVPLRRDAGWEPVKDFAHAISIHMATTFPKLFSAKMGPRNRIGKIFIDYLRNSRGASTVAAYSTRARPGLGVSVPVSWDEVPQLESADQWNVKTLGTRLKQTPEDPWAAYWKTQQRITAAMKRKLELDDS